MKIEIQAPWEVNRHLKHIIQKKVDKLERYNNQIQQTNIFLKMEGKKQLSDKIVELRIQTPKHLLFAESRQNSFEKSVADVTDKMRIQLVKLREQQTAHQ